jgi:basic membrane protein A and related proteins
MRSIVALVAFASLASAASGTSPQLRVAYVTDVVASPSPHTLRGVALLGFERAIRAFHVQARVVQFDPRQGPGPTLASLARQRYDLVLMGEVQSGLDVDAVVAVGKRFPQTRFVLVDPPFIERWPKNVQGSIWRVEEPAYLAGFLAGLEEKIRTGRDVVGSIGGYPIVSVNAFIAGFQAGAKKADPGITTLRAYTYNFFSTAKCRAAALSQITQGAGVLFNVAGACGLGTLRAAKDEGVWGVGVDVDQSFLGPHILTSVLKRFDVEIYDTVRALVNGHLKTGGNAVWDVRNGAVGLGPISPKVPRSYLRRVERIRREIAWGGIKVPSALR